MDPIKAKYWRTFFFFFLNLETLFPEEAESYFRGLLVEKVDF